MVVGAFSVQAVKGPNSVAAEEGLVAAGEHLVENAVVAELPVVIHVAERLLHLARGGVGHVQRAERGLARPAGDDFLQVVEEDVLGLAREVEDHVHVDRVEIRRGQPNALENLFAAAVLLVAIHLLEQVVVEALHAHAQALHATLQLGKIRLDQVVRVGLDAHFLDMEVVAGKVDGLAQLVKQDGRGAAAEVQRLEIPAAFFKHHHLAAQVLEVRARDVLAEHVAVEAAVGAEYLAERHMQVEHVLHAGFWRREEFLIRRLQIKVLLGHPLDQVRQKSFGKQVVLHTSKRRKSVNDHHSRLSGSNSRNGQTRENDGPLPHFAFRRVTKVRSDTATGVGPWRPSRFHPHYQIRYDGASVNSYVGKHQRAR